MIERYSRKEMARLFTDTARFGRWLDVEIAVCEVLGRRGLIPADAVRVIKEKAVFDTERIHAIEAEVRHDVIAFVSNVAENIGPEGRYVHYGLTSSAIIAS